MIETYNNDMSIDYYIENYVNNMDLKTIEELNDIANCSLNILLDKYNDNIKNYKTYENVYIISTYEFIKNNYKDKLLFYSMNHPTKYVLQYISEEIIKHLEIINTINYNIDPLTSRKPVYHR
jgi:hypothetical protein